MVKTYVDRSMLVPDDVMTRLMLPRLQQMIAHSWLLDGMNNRVHDLCFILLMHYGTPALCPLSRSSLHPLP